MRSTFYDSEDARVFTGDGSCDREKYFCDPKKIVDLERDYEKKRKDTLAKRDAVIDFLTERLKVYNSLDHYTASRCIRGFVGTLAVKQTVRISNCSTKKYKINLNKDDMTEAKEMCEEYRKADQADDIAYDKHEKEREHYENLKAGQKALLGKKEHLEDDAVFLRSGIMFVMLLMH